MCRSTYIPKCQCEKITTGNVCQYKPMSEQTITKGCCKQLVYKATDCLLEVGEPFQRLVAVFNTPSTYIPYTFVPNALVPTKVPTSVYKSIPNPKQGCQYLSWQQLSPPGMATSGLSWVIDKPGSVPNPLEIIQFLAPQLSYKVEWKARVTQPVLSPSPITFISVQPGASVAFEVPDICGKRIVITSQCGKSTSGSFIVPGQYGQFVISAPDRNIEMKLRVTGFFDTPNPYSVPTPPSTKYYVTLDCSSDKCKSKCRGKRVLAYTNTVIDPTTRTVQRVVSDKLATLEALVLEQYRSKSFFPCFPMATTVGALPPVGETNILYQSTFYIDPPTSIQNPNNFITDASIASACGGSITQPVIPPGGITPIVPGDTTIAQYTGTNQPQFTMQGGRTYKLTLTWTNNFQSIGGYSPSFRDYLTLNGPSQPPPSLVPSYICEFSDFVFALLSGNSLVSYIKSLSSPPPNSDPNNIMFRLQFQDVQGSGIDTQLVFGLPHPDSGESITYTYVFKLGTNTGETIPLSAVIASPVFGWVESGGRSTYFIGGSHDLTMNLVFDEVTVI